MYAASWCPDCRQARNFLLDRQIPFEEIDIEAHPEAVEFVKIANSGKRRIPTFDAGGRIFSCSPFDARKFARELGV